MVRALSSIRPGHHLCLFTETVEESFGAIGPFLTAGLDRRERCLLLCAGASTEAASAELRRVGVRVDEVSATGSLSILPLCSLYGDGDAFSPDIAIDRLEQAAREAAAARYVTLRVVLEMTPALREPDGQARIVAFASHLRSRLSASARVITLCQYSAEDVAPGHLMGILSAYPHVIYRRTLCENPFCAAPERMQEAHEPAANVRRFLQNLIDREILNERMRGHRDALRESAARFRLLFEHMPDAVTFYEPILNASGKPIDYRISDVNPSAEHSAGLVKPAYIGKTLREVLPDDERMWLAHLDTLHSTGRPARFEFFAPSLGRHLRAVAYSPQPGVLATVMSDVTPEVLASRERRANEARLRALLHLQRMRGSTDDAVASYILEIATLLSDSAAAYIDFAELDGATCRRVACTGDAPELANCGSRRMSLSIAGGGLWAEPFRTGEPVIANDLDPAAPTLPETPPEHPAVRRFMGIPVVDGGRVVAVAGFANKSVDYDHVDRTHVSLLLQDMWAHLKARRDEEEREALRSRVEQSQRLESVGVLAGGIAHDFNNILTGILGFTDLTLDALGPDSPQAPYLRHVVAGAERARDLVEQILTFSRGSTLERKPILLHEVLHDALRFIRASLPATIEIHREIDLNAPTVMGDPTQIHQVFANLCTNAHHAMKGGSGTLTVALRATDVKRAEARRLDLPEAGSYVEMLVSDTGVGMPSDVMAHIFEPFYTTKPVGEGTGLGLSTCYGIVRAHEGAITVTSTPGAGTTFRVLLPATTQRPRRAAADPAAASGGTGSARILLVDDEAALVAMCSSMLHTLGYEVVECVDSEVARSRFEAEPAAFDLVMTDHTMPRATGIDLAASVRRLRTDIPIILMTGHHPDVTPEALDQHNIAIVMKKPYTRQQIADAVQRALMR